MKFKIFDSLYKPGRPYSARILFAESLLHPSCPFSSIHHSLPVPPGDWIPGELRRVVAAGGEGLVVRDPTAAYREGRRTGLKAEIFKIKERLDSEGIVVDSNTVGSLLIEDVVSKLRFRIGSGFARPPLNGTVVSYEYSSLHEKSKIPRFPRFIRVRTDLDI